MKIKEITKAFSVRGNSKPRELNKDDATIRISTAESDDSSNSLSGARLRVRFVEQPIHQHAPRDSDVDIKELWYTTEECKRLKDADNYTRKLVYTTVSITPTTSEPTYGSVLIRTHEACSQAKEDVAFPLSQAQQDELKQQLNLWNPRVGLENPIIKSVAKKDVYQRRKRTLEEAKKLTKDSYFPADNRLTTISRPAKLFAMHIGMAHAPNA
eukprot:CAMPEP_0168759512 /NCGR_PEP_ID=MMETSP0724-20121128/22264_1 /TAXON_ID=265536 /ORGANISM="Amphiprora sp., Strain CCMP467" /LENGTH=211 /DNA_ID=CAMNT_0008808443 /DNA_START=142 /DNA_END=774 /DNA_ORIENTATION=+